MDELLAGDPRRIGPYRLEGRLGAGGMGRVYLGRSPGGRPVAIKAIRGELAESADFRARFAQEVEAARKVSGIFTVSVVDADLDGPVPWLATSFVAGPSLASAVEETGPLPAGSVLTLAAGLAEGLSAIHAAGVVHRDLKPSNVILGADGPQVLDFGISRAAEATALTHTGMVVGSPGFMSPEQAEGRDVGPASDVFSLGAVLAFAGTGQGPFGEGSTAALVYRVVHADPDIAAQPEQIRPVIERCLAKDPQRRPTAAQLLTEVGASHLPPPQPVTNLRAQNSAPQLATPTASERAYPPHPVTERAAPAGQAEAGPASTPATITGAGHHPPGDGAEPPRRHSARRRWLIVIAAVAAVGGAAAGVLITTDGSRPGPPGQAAVHSARQANRPTAGTSATSSAPATSSTPAGTQSPGAATAATLGSYLAQSATVRPTVQAAINGMETCHQTPASAMATLQQAISTRQRIVAGLQTLSPAGLPSGAQLITGLTTAMQDSISADRDYRSWMAEFTSSGYPCGSSPGNDPSYTAGLDASQRAQSAKNAFLSTWNPMAPRYQQKTYSGTGF